MPPLRCMRCTCLNLVALLTCLYFQSETNEYKQVPSVWWNYLTYMEPKHFEMYWNIFKLSTYKPQQAKVREVRYAIDFSATVYVVCLRLSFVRNSYDLWAIINCDINCDTVIECLVHFTEGAESLCWLQRFSAVVTVAMNWSWHQKNVTSATRIHRDLADHLWKHITRAPHS